MTTRCKSSSGNSDTETPAYRAQMIRRLNLGCYTRRMATETGLLRDPVELAARKVALTLLERAEKQARHLARTHPDETAPVTAEDAGLANEPSLDAEATAESSDSEALHNFRVALRRLRTHLGAYRRYLDKRVAGRPRNRLKILMDQTSGDRDGEVHRAWLAHRLSLHKVPQLERAGLELLALQVLQPCEQGGEYADVIAGFRRASAQLRSRLQVGSQIVKLDAQGRSRTFGVTVGDLVQTTGTKLRAQLAAITSPADNEAGHEARLSAKKLRYMLEPLGQDAPESWQLVRDLKRLQDLLGSLHDLHTLEPQVRRVLRRAVRRWRSMLENKAEARVTLSTLSTGTPELQDCYAAAAVVRRLHLEQVAHHRRLVAWRQGEPSKGFFARLEAMAESLRAGGFLP